MQNAIPLSQSFGAAAIFDFVLIGLFVSHFLLRHWGHRLHSMNRFVSLMIITGLMVVGGFGLFWLARFFQWLPAVGNFILLPFIYLHLL